MTPKEFLDQVATLCSAMAALQNETNRALSEADRTVSAIYHEIELTHFNAVQGYLLAKRLQAALAVRRSVKREQEQLALLYPLLTTMRNRRHECVRRLSRCEAKQSRFIKMALHPSGTAKTADSA